MNAGIRTPYRSNIRPLFRYGIAFSAAWGAMFLALLAWGLSKGGMIEMGEFFVFAAIWSILITLFCILLSLTLRVPLLGRFWFGRRLPAIVSIVMGHAIYFTVNWSALNSTPLARVYPSYDPISVSMLGIVLFTLGFTQFPYFRHPSLPDIHSAALS
jgi:hypothetical protein